MHPDSYQTIERISIAEYKDKGSRFIAYAFPVDTSEAIQQQLTMLKAEHPKAVHHCYAFRIGTDKNNWRAQDDGEPSGSAGKPILGQIDSFGLTNLLIVVVRYFGGTLLGVPGLIQAYKSASRQALQSASIITRQLETACCIRCAYERQFDIMKLLKQRKIPFTVHAEAEEIRFTLSVPVNRFNELKSVIGDFAIIECP